MIRAAWRKKNTVRMIVLSKNNMPKKADYGGTYGV